MCDSVRTFSVALSVKLTDTNLIKHSTFKLDEFKIVAIYPRDLLGLSQYETRLKSLLSLLSCDLCACKSDYMWRLFSKPKQQQLIVVRAAAFNCCKVAMVAMS